MRDKHRQEGAAHLNQEYLFPLAVSKPPGKPRWPWNTTHHTGFQQWAIQDQKNVYSQLLVIREAQDSSFKGKWISLRSSLELFVLRLPWLLT